MGINLTHTWVVTCWVANKSGHIVGKVPCWQEEVIVPVTHSTTKIVCQLVLDMRKYRGDFIPNYYVLSPTRKE